MGLYAGSNPGITPNTSNDNWSLNTGSGETGRIYEFQMGGEVTTSTAMRTVVARSSGGTTPTTGNVQKIHPSSPTNLIDFVTSWSAQPSLTAGSLVTIGWNAHGGSIRWLAAPGEELIILASAQVSCRNSIGTAQSSYGLIWGED